MLGQRLLSVFFFVTTLPGIIEEVLEAASGADRIRDASAVQRRPLGPWQFPVL